jgi:hypothetical protein
VVDLDCLTKGIYANTFEVYLTLCKRAFLTLLLLVVVDRKLYFVEEAVDFIDKMFLADFCF